MTNHCRSQIMDEQEGLNNNIDENVSLVRNTLITQETQSEVAMHSVLKQSKEKLSKDQENQDGNPKISKILCTELMNEHTENH